MALYLVYVFIQAPAQVGESLSVVWQQSQTEDVYGHAAEAYLKEIRAMNLV